MTPDHARMPDHKAMMHLGAIAQQAYAENPTDINEVIRAVEGGEKLLGFVKERLRKLDSDRVDRETVRLLAAALQAMAQAHQTLVLTYALSGQAADDLMGDIRRGLGVDGT